MRLLLDHCVDRRIASAIVGHEVRTAAEMGWSALTNGLLLSAAASAGFDALITTDKNLRHQQNIDRLPIAVIELNTRDTRRHSLLPLLARLDPSVELLRSFRFVIIHADGRLEALSPR